MGGGRMSQSATSRRRGVPTVLSDLARRFPALVRAVTSVHRTLYTRSSGRLLGRWFGAPVLVLETTGRRSGRRHAAALVYVAHADGYAVIPANAGASRPPDWWSNLQATEAGVAVVGGRRCAVRPRVAAGPDRDQLWQRFCEVAPIDHYQRRAGRRLPVVILAADPSEERQ
jgi:deazaflavin-dependent oxidoreductase (nitroreductase family)